MPRELGSGIRTGRRGEEPHRAQLGAARALVVTAELPGVNPKDVHVTLDDGVLTIAGERQFEGGGDSGRVFRTERAYGNFRRSFSVPRTVNGEAISAEHKDGTLR